MSETNRLEEIRARAANATDGPWRVTEWSDYGEPARPVIASVNGYEIERRSISRAEDAQFMAHARVDVPWLLGEVDRLTNLVENGSDGYHTFDELYHHRAALFALVCSLMPGKAWKSRLHDDGTMIPGFFIVGVFTPAGPVTYHYSVDRYWDAFTVPELEKAPPWDGHTPDDAAARMRAAAKVLAMTPARPSVTAEQIEAAADAIRRRDEFEDTTQEHHRILAREALSAALGLDVEAGEGHEFLPVRGHPDDDECTHRADGTDATYSRRIRAPRVYRQGASVYVIGTDDVREACQAAGINEYTHRWASTGYGLYVRRQGSWRGASDYLPPKDARPGVAFYGPIVEEVSRG